MRKQQPDAFQLTANALLNVAIPRSTQAEDRDRQAKFQIIYDAKARRIKIDFRRPNNDKLLSFVLYDDGGFCFSKLVPLDDVRAFAYAVVEEIEQVMPGVYEVYDSPVEYCLFVYKGDAGQKLAAYLALLPAVRKAMLRVGPQYC